MYISDINFPNQIVDAIQNRSLVVFAGAGASVDSPTSLPNFENLAKEIAEGTGYKLKKSDSCEVFLGMLKSKGIPVNEQAAEILSGTCVEHNKLHEAIIDLFPDLSGIRIITTNYDQMFEHVLLSRGMQTSVHNIPALPLGNDVHGIVHIHGNVDNPDYMVLTDEDFGKAYLTEGYASRFLVKLFDTYTVLFVGYSYNDTILRYLTRAMSRNNTKPKYILTYDRTADWSALGIQPIWFPKRKFTLMREGLMKLGTIAKKGLLDWKNQLTEISEAPPKDLTADTEIDYCLECIERTRVLANCVHGKAWISFLDEKNVFDGCFSENEKLSERDLIWGHWLCDNFIGKEDDSILKLLYSHNNRLNPEFAAVLAHKIIGTDTLADDCFSAYVVLIERKLNNSWLISRLIDISKQRNLFKIGFHLYKKLLASRIILQRGWFSKESYDYKHAFDGECFEIQHAWGLIKDEVCEQSACSVLYYVQEKIEEVHNQYECVNMASKDTEPWEMARMVIEDREESSYRDDALQVLVQMYIDATMVLAKIDSDKLRYCIWSAIESESILLKKIALKAMRISSVFEPEQAVDILINQQLLDLAYVKEQVFLLVADILNKLDDNKMNALLDAIENLEKGSEDKSQTYTVYNWCVWLQRIEENNTRINNIVKSYHDLYNYAPRNHPEFDIESSSAVWIPDKSPLSDVQLKDMKCSDAVVFLRDFNDNPFDGPSRYGLLKVFETCITQDYLWSKEIITELIASKIHDEEIWQHVFQGLEHSEVPLADAIELLELLSAHVSDIGYDKDLSYLLFTVTRRDDVKNNFSKYEHQLYSVSKVIWNKRTRKKVDVGRFIDLTLNSTIGTILLSWIYMISYMDELSIPNAYKEDFESVLKLRTWEKSVSVCILAGHFNFLCYRDKDWCINHLVPLLIGNDKKVFSNAWEGMIFFSGRINKDTVDILSPVFFKSIKHIGWLSDETKRGFIELLLTLLIHAVDKPTLKFIPEFYRSVSEEEIILFIDAVEHRLKSMNDSEKKKWWNTWLKHFLDNRKRSKPVPLMDKENQAILELLLELDFVFGEAVQTICRGLIPNNVDGLFWFSYHQKKLADRFPHDTAIVITKVLNASSVSSYDNSYIKDIVKDIKGLNDKEQKMLQEALLRKNIVFD